MNPLMLITGKEGTFCSVSSPLSVVSKDSMMQKWLVRTPPGGKLELRWEVMAKQAARVRVDDLHKKKYWKIKQFRSRDC